MARPLHNIEEGETWRATDSRPPNLGAIPLGGRLFVSWMGKPKTLPRRGKVDALEARLTVAYHRGGLVPPALSATEGGPAEAPW